MMRKFFLSYYIFFSICLLFHLRVCENDVDDYDDGGNGREKEREGGIKKITSKKKKNFSSLLTF